MSNNAYNRSKEISPINCYFITWRILILVLLVIGFAVLYEKSFQANQYIVLQITSISILAILVISRISGVFFDMRLIPKILVINQQPIRFIEVVLLLGYVFCFASACVCIRSIGEETSAFIAFTGVYFTFVILNYIFLAGLKQKLGRYFERTRRRFQATSPRGKQLGELEEYLMADWIVNRYHYAIAAISAIGILYISQKLSFLTLDKVEFIGALILLLTSLFLEVSIWIKRLQSRFSIRKNNPIKESYFGINEKSKISLETEEVLINLIKSGNLSEVFKKISSIPENKKDAFIKLD